MAWAGLAQAGVAAPRHNPFTAATPTITAALALTAGALPLLRYAHAQHLLAGISVRRLALALHLLPAHRTRATSFLGDRRRRMVTAAGLRLTASRIEACRRGCSRRRLWRYNVSASL